MKHTITTRKGSTYVIDTEARTFHRTGAGHADVTGVTVTYRDISVSADPRQGVRFELGPGHWLRTSPVEEGHHELYIDVYHRALDPEENRMN